MRLLLLTDRLKLGRNNHRSLEGSGIKLDMSSNLTALLERNRELYCEWYGIFIENIFFLYFCISGLKFFTYNTHYLDNQIV